MRYNVDLLETFLADLKRATGRSRWKTTVEFRDPSWLCPPVYRLLDRHKVALCLADLPQCPITDPNDAAFVYMRRHGLGGRYAAKYIIEDTALVRRWLGEGRDVFVYYNNDIGGYAVENAGQLTKALNT